MSRRRTDSAIEHRITLGDYERRELKQILAVSKKTKQTENVITSVKAGAFVAAAGAGVFVGYLGVLAYAAVKDGLESALDAITGKVKSVPISFFNWVAGSKSYIDPETGIEYIVPKTVTDANGTVIENNIRIPILGGINYVIMLFGNFINPIPFFYDPNEDQDSTVPTGGWYGPHIRGHPNHQAWLAGEYVLTEAENYKWQVYQFVEAQKAAVAARDAERRRLLEEQNRADDFTGPVIDMEKEEEARAQRAAAEAAAKAAAEAEQDAEAAAVAARDAERRRLLAEQNRDEDFTGPVQ
jgi:hypothetical protein